MSSGKTLGPPDGPEIRTRSFLGAFNKGRDACRSGKPKRANPYPDHRTDYHRGVTFSRAYRNYWNEGWDYEMGKRWATEGLFGRPVVKEADG